VQAVVVNYPSLVSVFNEENSAKALAYHHVWVASKPEVTCLNLVTTPLLQPTMTEAPSVDTPTNLSSLKLKDPSKLTNSQNMDFALANV
jgi:hypothetical protein